MWAVWIGVVACSPHVPDGADPTSCAPCHPAEVDGHSPSRHARAATHPVFVRSFGESRDPWCTTCHLEGGVSCATCHAADARTCADCHQFDQPTSLDPLVFSATPVQDTVAEVARGALADHRCTDCHDPHAVPGVAMMRDTVQTRVHAVPGGAVVRVVAHGAAHAVPTGDPFRRLVLTLYADLACTAPVGELWLDRRLAPDPETGWRVVWDERIPPPSSSDGSSVEHLVPGPPSRAWRLVYHLADPRHERDLGADASFVVATGLVVDGQ